MQLLAIRERRAMLVVVVGDFGANGATVPGGAALRLAPSGEVIVVLRGSSVIVPVDQLPVLGADGVLKEKEMRKIRDPAHEAEQDKRPSENPETWAAVPFKGGFRPMHRATGRGLPRPAPELQSRGANHTAQPPWRGAVIRNSAQAEGVFSRRLLPRPAAHRPVHRPPGTRTCTRSVGSLVRTATLLLFAREGALHKRLGVRAAATLVADAVQTLLEGFSPAMLAQACPECAPRAVQPDSRVPRRDLQTLGDFGQGIPRKVHAAQDVFVVLGQCVHESRAASAGGVLLVRVETSFLSVRQRFFVEQHFMAPPPDEIESRGRHDAPHPALDSGRIANRTRALERAESRSLIDFTRLERWESTSNHRLEIRAEARQALPHDLFGATFSGHLGNRIRVRTCRDCTGRRPRSSTHPRTGLGSRTNSFRFRSTHILDSDS